MRAFLEDPDTDTWDGPPVCLSAIRGPEPRTIADTHEDPHFSVCSETFRYTFCTTGEEELYDHRSDPHEWTNQAGNPEFGEVKRLLRKEMARILETTAYRAAHADTRLPY
jgi:hypothetical protein